MKNKELAYSIVRKGHDPLEGNEHPAVSTRVNIYTVLPQIQLPGRFRGYTVGLQARETGLLAHEMP